MEVKTGDVKAIVNMSRAYDSQVCNPFYYEAVNNAISYRCEPGLCSRLPPFSSPLTTVL